MSIMQAYFESEQAFSISMSQLVFEISIAYKKTCSVMVTTARFRSNPMGSQFPIPILLNFYLKSVGT